MSSGLRNIECRLDQCCTLALDLSFSYVKLWSGSWHGPLRGRRGPAIHLIATEVFMAKKRGKAEARSTSSTKKRSKIQKHDVDFEDHVCACDLEFRDSEATLDADLPPARGGVEGEKLRRRLRSL